VSNAIVDKLDSRDAQGFYADLIELPSVQEVLLRLKVATKRQLQELSLLVGIPVRLPTGGVKSKQELVTELNEQIKTGYATTT
jgi:hypothetical protein